MKAVGGKCVSDFLFSAWFLFYALLHYALFHWHFLFVLAFLIFPPAFDSNMLRKKRQEKRREKGRKLPNARKTR